MKVCVWGGIVVSGVHIPAVDGFVVCILLCKFCVFVAFMFDVVLCVEIVCGVRVDFLRGILSVCGRTPGSGECLCYVCASVCVLCV